MTNGGGDQVLTHLDYPMVIVTAVADGERSGCLVGFHTQCSIEPPHYLVCISEANHTAKVAARATALGIHFLSQDDRELARLFGAETGDEVDKFAECEWSDGPLGIPLLAVRGGWLAGTILDRRPVGDHVATVIDVAASHRQGDFRQLGFQQLRDMEPGHPA
jgi:flavin reductase (DIM6/NTAB) family NADH-FMN oxidoreductase RutF